MRRRVVEQPALDALEAGAQMLVVMNASPFHRGKSSEREQAMQVRSQATGLPLIYAHLVGGQDEVVFEGRSFALQANGELAGRAPSFADDLFHTSLYFGCLMSWRYFRYVFVSSS